MSLHAPFAVGLGVTSLCLKRGHRSLVNDIHLALAPGEALALRGTNGSGKTTLLRALAGLHQPLAGKIEWSGHETDSEPTDFIGFVGHLDAIKAGQSVKSQLQFWADLSDAPRAQAEAAIAQVGLLRQSDLAGGVLSAGQRRRLALARLLLQNRPVWLLDEPAAPLDGEGRAVLGTLLDEHRARGGLVIAAVHDTLPGAATQTLWLDQQP